MENIIITGASNGIGRVIAKNLRKKYHVINIDIVENKMDRVDFYKCDISDKWQLLKTIEKIKTNIDSLYALVNNAGILRDKMLVTMDESDWDSVINVHLRGHFCPTQAAAQYWRNWISPDHRSCVVEYGRYVQFHQSGIFWFLRIAIALVKS